MNKLMIKRAQQFAAQLIANRRTVRNWTHEGAQDYLEQAYQAGARSMDRWHKRRLAKAVGVDGTVHAGFSIMSTDDGKGEVLTIPALAADTRRPHGSCLACGRALRAQGRCSSDECPGLGGSYGGI